MVREGGKGEERNGRGGRRSFVKERNRKGEEVRKR